jgi:predicted HTH domain antitoxin
MNTMQVTFDIPDTLAAQLTAAGKDPARAALEALLVEGYRTDTLTSGEIKRILGYSTRMQVHALLKEHNVPLNYGVEEFEQDMETIRKRRERQVSTAA